MSKKVVTFLVLLACVTAVVILMARQGRPPVTVEGTVAQATEATKPADSASGSTLLGNDNPEVVTAPKTDAKPDEKKEEKAEDNAEDKAADAAPISGEANDADKIKLEEPKAAVAEPVKIEPAPQPETAAPIGSLLNPSAATEVDMDNALAERAMGDPDAPVVMIEYASMTCPHCARFHNEILAKVKASLIDTGKLRLILRDYPLDTHALRAAMMARCTDRSRYFNLVEVIFKNQDRWVKSTDPLSGLKQLGALAGMDTAFIDNCIKNPELEKFILNGMQEAQRKYKIKATPTFIFNNDAEQLSGDQNPEDFERVVNQLIKKKGQ